MTHDHTPFTLRFDEIDIDDLARVGGKGANLGSLTRAGVRVPPGFCVTTSAFDRFISQLADADARFATLDALEGTAVEEARRAGEQMREALAHIAIPSDVAESIVRGWRVLGESHPLAVRSSATAEDLPGASFAGQQDTYLNIQGEAALLDAVRRCWISLFTDRAVLYRARNGFGHRSVKLSVVVQQLVDPDVSGILFTADPISGHRHVASIDAGFGLGEALVSGLISADLYKVDRRRRAVILAEPGDKAFAIRSIRGGGTEKQPLSDEQRRARSLDDAQVLALADIGARVEAHYRGVPQDIEWCIADGTIYVVQSRPITSLFPIPQRDTPPTDDGLRAFISFGHIQMMLDAMPRLSLETWRLFFPAGKGGVPTLHTKPILSPAMATAGGRIYIDATAALRVKRARGALVGLLSHVYEELGRAIDTITRRPKFLEVPGNAGPIVAGAAGILGPVIGRVPYHLLFSDPATALREFDDALESMPRIARARIEAAGTRAQRIRQSAVEINSIFTSIRPRLSRLLAGVIAHGLLTRAVRASWADGVRDDVEVLRRGLPGNVTTEMDLAVGDLGDLVRPHPELATLLREGAWREIRPRLASVPGGAEFLAAFERFLSRYGERGASEIDLSRPRWRDDPALLLRVIVGGLAANEPSTHRKQHRAQFEAGEAAAARIIAAAPRMRRWWITRLCRVARAGMGLREHPKFTIVTIFGTIRAEVLAAGDELVQRGQLAERRDAFHLGYEELAHALETPSLDLRGEVAKRIESFARDRARKPPIVITSDGETPTLAIDRADLPPGALPGTAASAGVVEGIARVVTDPDREVLHAGEILVAPFTDPGWTPLFVHAAGVVTEVGGMMTHGAVVAREYGIPAVVSVTSALSRIKSGQRIRVDGTRGFVEILEEAAS